LFYGTQVARKEMAELETRALNDEFPLAFT
jgi:hypothetical protein